MSYFPKYSTFGSALVWIAVFIFWGAVLYFAFN